MSYYIEYNPELKKQYPAIKKSRRKPTIKVLWLLLVAVMAYVFLQGDIMRILIPGDPDVTISALSTLVEQVGAGESVKESVLSFCEEIIVNGHG